MAAAVLVLLLVLATGASVLLALKALRYWYGQRAGLAYELPVDRRGTVLRAGASGAAALLAAGVAVPLLHGSGTGPPRTRAVAAQEPEAAPPPPRTPEPAPPPPQVRTLGRPAGGVLQVLGDGTRVWLPPRYPTASAADLAYPVVIADISSSDPDLYPAFAAQANRGLADSFLLVTPPSCGADPAAVLTEVAARYRTLTARTARAVIGVGPQAPCALHEALSHPDRYAAAAGISGSYPATARPTGRYPSLLLAATTAETGPRASALRLRTSLHPAGDQVRLLDGVPRQRDLLAQVATYLTEKLDGPTRTPTAHLTPAPGMPPAPVTTAPAAGQGHRAPGPVPAPPSAPAPQPSKRPAAPSHATGHAPHSAPRPAAHTPASGHGTAHRSAPATSPKARPARAPSSTSHRASTGSSANSANSSTSSARPPASTPRAAARPTPPAPH